MNPTPVFHVRVVSRNTKAVNYQHHSGSTEVDFRGTDLVPEARGKAKVESRTGRVQIEAEFQNLLNPKTLGPEYLTYVLWGITPEGRTANLGEVLPKPDGKLNLTVSTDLQAFGLILTAEPYFAVTRPSNEVVAENVIRPNTKGWEVPIDAKYDLLERGDYTVNLPPEQLPSATADARTPLNLLQAENAVAMARAAQADKYAPEAFARAEDFLRRAKDYYRRKQSDKAIGTVARGAAQSAEEARVLALKRRQQEWEEAQRREIENRARQAQEQAQQAQEQAQKEAEQRAAAEEARRLAEQERERAEQAKAEAERERLQAEAAKSAAVAQQQAAEQQAEQARLQAQRAEQEREDTRNRLTQQLSQVLQTRESARGLIVSMPDVLFDTGKSSLKPGARERLAKVAGILLAYPGLKVQVEGHTDSTGTAEFNQKLSENRAEAVRTFLMSQGVSPDSITAQGFGQENPVATNSTAAGRQLNRRVDIVVNGAAIATTQTSTGTTTTNTRTDENRTVPASTMKEGTAPEGTTITPATPPPSTGNSAPPE